MLTRGGVCILAAVTLSACGQKDRDEPLRGRVPVEPPSGLEKTLRDVPPGLRNDLQDEIACERGRSATQGRRFRLDAGAVEALTRRLAAHAPRCADAAAHPVTNGTNAER